MNEKSRADALDDPHSRAAPAAACLGKPGSAQQFADIVEFLPDAAFAIDRDGRVVVWNRACEELTGVGREAVLGQGDQAYAEPFFGRRRPTLVDLLGAHARAPAAMEAYESVRWVGEVVQAETFSPRVRAGRGGHMQATAFRVFDGGGRWCGAVELNRDITGQKRVERALEESRQRLLEAQRLAGVGFVDWDLRTDRVFVSEETRELTGFRPEGDVSSADFLARMVHPEDEAEVRRNLDLAVRGVRDYDIVHRHLRPDGRVVWVRARAELSRNAAGDPSRILGTFVDITRQKRVEDALREREAQLSLILNNVSDIIFAVEVEGGGAFRFAWVNERFLQTTGLSAAQVTGALVRDVIPESAHEVVFARYREAIRTGKPMHWEEASEYPAGLKLGHVTVVPVFDDAGTCIRLVGMVHDVTERRQAEDEVRRLNDDLRRHADVLEERVRARTAQLAARNQELKDFAYTVSHDLKAPLRGIAGYANELSRKHAAGLSDRARFCAGQIVSAATNLDRLIEDLLHYSRLDAETPSVVDVDVRALIDTILRDRHLEISEQRVEVTVEVPAGATVRAWERGLVQVVTNLVDNAIKYSRHAGTPRIRIAAAVVEDEWQLTVADNGIGFDMKYHDRIFGLFNRLVRMEDYEGTGAGLAIVKKVLDKQGGRVWARSAPGEGATFFVALPAVWRPE